MRKGLLVIISSPSGGGKDSVIRALLKHFPNSARLVTTASRPPRPGNREGADYYFISKKEFEEKISRGDFVEHNLYADNYYGTQKRHLDENLQKYDLVLTQIEVNGKHNFDKAGIPHLSIFLLPENLEVLRQRILNRGGITPKVMEERLRIAKKEIEDSKDYNFQIVNFEGKLPETTDKIAKIIKDHLTERGGS